MNTHRIITSSILTVGCGLAVLAARAHDSEAGSTKAGASSAGGDAHAATARETITVAANEPIPNVPGKRLVSHVVDYPPGGGSVPHRHAGSAFIYAYVVSGAVRSQHDDGPPRVYRAGETWFEKPGAHHRVSENASDTEPARLLAVVIVDEADKQVTIPDRK